MLSKIFQAFNPINEMSNISLVCKLWKELTIVSCFQQLYEKQSISMKELTFYNIRLRQCEDMSSNWDDIFRHCKNFITLDFSRAYQEKYYGEWNDMFWMQDDDICSIIKSAGKHCRAISMIDFTDAVHVGDSTKARIEEYFPDLKYSDFRYKL